MVQISHNLENTDSSVVPKTLYVVATPIGNIEDITIRALKVLNQVDYIACEDTREIQKLLNHYHIKKPLITCHDHNESQCAETIIAHLENSKSIALVSDAGTPTVSDPGFRVVSIAIESEISVKPIPGVSAAMAALCVSGLPTDTFVFQGFLPKKQGKRQKLLKQLSMETKTIVLYESPKRVATLINEMVQHFGDRQAMLGRELTKPYEECIRGKLSAIHAVLVQKKAIKGEFTVLVAGYSNNKVTDDASLVIQVEKYLNAHNNQSLSHNVKKIGDIAGGIAEKNLYDRFADKK
ncbi:MAG: 16S rRNA (cytidine1402-2'-O)-methyltransferase [Candidatus Magnetoglobus multicellularis str. Araruama]|uniref:Ribosomal RNA small subunit methyltransferase I n=1 Tax=Candidatus Magnetoglobus multicellularis str. Araruama TaxID=890399 RepID=A0A1V1PBA0_9BACT|nr:MAG: 16S rRNA (cytidine1402-2'-O)-methyltransferase [Candidatus Magnetoglobus multicellularis str. Araruama]